jgi:hypothetical protein
MHISDVFMNGSQRGPPNEADILRGCARVISPSIRRYLGQNVHALSRRSDLKFRTGYAIHDW